MNLIPILNLLLGIEVWQIAKALILFSVFLYLVFALVIIRQVSLMLDTLEVELEGLIKFIAWLHLLLVVVVFVFGIVYL